MGMLTEDLFDVNRLERFAGSAVFERGRVYYNQRRVEVDFVEPDYASCTVVGRNDVYNVLIKAERNRLIFHCDCPFAENGAICKHSVASFLTVRDHLRKHKPARWQSQLNRIIQTLPGVNPTTGSAPYLLVFSLQNTAPPGGYPSWDLMPYTLPLHKLAAEQRSALHVGESAADLLHRHPNLIRQMTAPVAAISTEDCVNSPPSVVTIANMLIEQARIYSRLAPLASALSLLAGSPALLFQGTRERPLEKPLEVHLQPARIQLDLSHVSVGVRLASSLALNGLRVPLKMENVHLLSSSPPWVLAEGVAAPLLGETSAALFTNLMHMPELLIPPDEQAEFLQDYFLPLAENAELRGDAVVLEDIHDDPVKRLFLSDERGEFTVQVRFGYGTYEVPYDLKLPTQTLLSQPGTWTLANIIRQPLVEQAMLELLSSKDYGLKRAPSPALPGTFNLRSKVHPADFLLRYVPLLTESGFEIYGEDKLKTARVNRSKASLSLSVSSGIDWFDVQATVRFGEIEVAFKEVRRALQKRERYIKLADGSLGEIPTDWMQRYRHLFALGQENQQGLRFSATQVTLLDQLLEEAELSQADDEFRLRSERLRNFAGIQERPLPQGFTGELRPYQKAGFDWLHFLHEYGFGGCLADDMGLGKTVQVLTFLLSLREAQHPTKPDLIVLPRSLLVNWQREATRFTPSLRILEYHGGQRQKDPATFDQHDLVVTTYGIMMRDIQFLREYPFHYVVLDESQSIKNPLAQTSKAARLLQSDHRLVMTGTPVENAVHELWSQFSFLNPGMLGSLDHFKEAFAAPIERKTDTNSASQAQLLRRMVFPFILRRSKAQVAPELPPRTERIIYTDMESSQRKLYLRTRDYYRGMLMGLMETQGLEQSRFKILEGLLRLRQICNHPALAERNFHGESAKFELLLETLETLHSENHKVLIFSQFVEMLKLVRRELDRRNLPYEYLDGHTRNRQDHVDRFQSDPAIPFFLISLKAGGVGLNLTAADYVIHIDPWWNPAVEMQASDRTHRIGQDKPVFVYKLIVRESVEEKILALQERKKELVEQIIGPEGGLFKSLTAEDVQQLFS